MYRILSIEDNPDAEKVLKSHIERYAAETGLAFSITWKTSAFDLAGGDETHFDLIFLDIELPGMLVTPQDLAAAPAAATAGTAAWLREHGIDCTQINKVLEGRPHVVDLIKNGEIVYIVNTTEGRQAIADSFSIRREALQHRVTYSTTVAGARALVHSLEFRGTGPVLALQELHKELRA